MEQNTQNSGALVKKDYRDTLAKFNDLFLPIVSEQMETHSIKLDPYQKQCVMNASASIFSLVTDKGLSINDIDRSNIAQIVERAAVLRLNAYSQPREVYFQTRKKKIGNNWVTQVEMGIEGDGNDAILRNFGVDVDTIFTPWLVREGDTFVYPKYKGVEVTPPEWEPKGTGKVTRVVYPIKKLDGTVEYHISERADVRKNLVAHVANNMMNETFGIAKDRYNATPEQKKKIDAKKAELMVQMEGKTVDEILDIPDLEPYISPAWRGEHSRESMIIRKMRNNAVKPIPKDFGNALGTSMYISATDDDSGAIITEITERENSGDIIDIPEDEVRRVEDEPAQPETPPSEPPPKPEQPDTAPPVNAPAAEPKQTKLTDKAEAPF